MNLLRLVFGLGGGLWLTVALAGEPTLADQRAALQRQLASEERACADRFLRNDCVHAARERQRGAEEALRRQELEQGEQARRRQAAQRLSQLSGKVVPNAAAQPRAAASAVSVVDREQQHQAQAAQRAAGARQRIQSRVQAQDEQARRLQEGPQREQQYQEKLRQAEQHRQDVQARRERQASSAARPLPVPP